MLGGDHGAVLLFNPKGAFARDDKVPITEKQDMPREWLLGGQGRVKFKLHCKTVDMFGIG